MQSLKMQILEILSEDCRQPLERIAVMTGATLAQVAQAIDELEQERVILQYSPVINWDRTDRERVEAMIEVKVTPQRDKGFDRIAERIYQFDEVESVYLMSGSFDLTVIISGRTLKEVASFVSERLSIIEGVTGTATHFILKKYKEKHALFVKQEEQTDRIAFV